MSSNIGSKIKVTAVVLAIIGCLASLIAGIWLIANSSHRAPTAGLGWGILIGGNLTTWLSFIFMYGFGELLEEAAATRYEICRIHDELKKQGKSAPEVGKEAPIFTEPKPVYHASPSSGKASGGAGGWKCRECGHSNETFRQSCQICGSSRNF